MADGRNFDTEPPGLPKPGGGYNSFSKDFGYIKTWKVSKNLPGLVIGWTGRCRNVACNVSTFRNRYSFHILRFPARRPCGLASREPAKRYARRPCRSSGRGMPADRGEPPFRGGWVSGGILALAGRRRRTRARPSTYKRRRRPAALWAGLRKGRALEFILYNIMYKDGNGFLGEEVLRFCQKRGRREGRK